MKLFTTKNCFTSVISIFIKAFTISIYIKIILKAWYSSCPETHIPFLLSQAPFYS